MKGGEWQLAAQNSPERQEPLDPPPGAAHHSAFRDRFIFGIYLAELFANAQVKIGADES
jgi:hypothetical protein